MKPAQKTQVGIELSTLGDIHEKSGADQQSLASLQLFHNAYQCLAALMQNDIPYGSFPLCLWPHQSKSGDRDE
ncbi:hypothetical protein O0I10_003777 [Lichtheimia ornata]|uniref:Uncharacterized protein n=1 Tax=Lichtheimia ornata TaxID=688661 RepID=A0AAD7XZM3_9FUNG|nr:uncharacterized protein O0I10_003777 [Lichtheimia ornata]KAJ8660320.1 hypothetical protein O0I10_003777 [Lichtheimia ornata]